MTLARTKLLEFLKDTRGKIFTATFIKRDGSIREMNCRRGVHLDLKGGENKVVKDSNAYTIVYDMKARGYRTLNLDTVMYVRYNHETYYITPEVGEA